MFEPASRERKRSREKLADPPRKKACGVRRIGDRLKEAYGLIQGDRKARTAVSNTDLLEVAKELESV